MLDVKKNIITFDEDSGAEVFSEICILLAAVLLGIHINKWGLVSNNFGVSILVIIFFVVIGIGLRSTLKK